MLCGAVTLATVIVASIHPDKYTVETFCVT